MTTDRYNAAEAEARWQKIWEERGFPKERRALRTREYPLCGSLLLGKTAVNEKGPPMEGP